MLESILKTIGRVTLIGSLVFGGCLTPKPITHKRYDDGQLVYEEVTDFSAGFKTEMTYRDGKLVRKEIENLDTGESKVLLDIPKPPSKHELYVSENLEEIMQSHEERFGVPIFNPPIIKLRDRERFRIPGIIKFGGYDSKTDEIYMISSNTYVPGIDTPSPDKKSIRSVLDHELGHYAHDQISEFLGRGDMPFVYGSFQGGEMDILDRVLAEGFAECIQGEFNSHGNCNRDPFDLNLLELTSFYYNCGPRFVQPIFEKYGFVGIMATLIMPPLSEERHDLFKYQERILEMLDGASN